MKFHWHTTLGCWFQLHVADLFWAWLGSSESPTGPWSTYMSYLSCTKPMQEKLYCGQAEEQEGPHNPTRTFQAPVMKLTDISLAKADHMAKLKLRE